MEYLNQTNTVPHPVTNDELHNCSMFHLHSHYFQVLEYYSEYSKYMYKLFQIL